MERERSDMSENLPQIKIEHLPELRRFELTRDGVELAHVEYVPRAGVWVFTHTWTEPIARGEGLAAKVVRAALLGARESGVTVRPVCPYVVDYLAEHREFNDLLVIPDSS